MINLNLRGVLGEKLGKNWELEVYSILEAFEAIEANGKRISNYYYDLNKFCTHFLVLVNGVFMPSHLINAKILKPNDKVEIVPVVQGSHPAVLIFIGIALMVLSYVLLKALSPKAFKDRQTTSTVLGNIRNVLNRNIPVPLGYGRLKVGSAVLSNNIVMDYTRTGNVNSVFKLYEKIDMNKDIIMTRDQNELNVPEKRVIIDTSSLNN